MTPRRFRTAGRGIGALLSIGLVAIGLAVIPAGPAHAAPVAPSVPLLVAGPACGDDADGDGEPDGEEEQLVTNGADADAQRLSVAGIDLSARTPGPLDELVVGVCVVDLDDGTELLTLLDVQTRRRSGIDEADRELRQGWLDDIEALLPEAVPDISPALGLLQVVGLETWLALHPVSWWTPATTTRTDPSGIVLAASVVPVRTVWDLGDGNPPVVCNGPGSPYTAGGTPTCSTTFEHTSVGAPDDTYQLRVHVEYAVTLTSSASGVHQYALTSEARPHAWQVGEIQTLVVEPGAIDGGDVASPSTPVELPPPDPPPDELPPLPQLDGCDTWDDMSGTVASWASFGLWGNGCGYTPGDFIDDVGQLLVLIPRPIRDFIAGCVNGLGITQLITTAVDAVLGLTNPVGYIQDKYNEAVAIVAAVADNPDGMLVRMGLETIGIPVGLLEAGQWARASGQMVCDILLTIVSGGSGKVAALARLLDADSIGAAGDAIRDLFPDRADKIIDELTELGDLDAPDPDLCPVNSFPAGTRVVLGDGTSLPIEAVQRGMTVLSADPITGRWSVQPVTDRWSHLDTGAMVTVRLSDGSHVSATDHHLFWVTDERRWLRADQLIPGHRLLGPEGTTAVVKVETWVRPTLVYDMTVAGPRTFTVLAGSTPILVHNADCLPDGVGYDIGGDIALLADLDDLESPAALELIEAIAAGSGAVHDGIVPDRLVLGPWDPRKTWRDAGEPGGSFEAWSEGSAGNYLDEAALSGGHVYDPPAGMWDSVGPDAGWAINEQFIRYQLEAGIPAIELSHGTVRDILDGPGTQDSGLWREMTLLSTVAPTYGYRLNDDGTGWVLTE